MDSLLLQSIAIVYLPLDHAGILNTSEASMRPWAYQKAGKVFGSEVEWGDSVM